MYRVYYTIVVDHPERRDASFKPVPTGHRIALVDEYKTQRAAVGLFDSMIRGEWDFSSEYVKRVSVYADNGRGGTRTVRREVQRPRYLRIRTWPGLRYRFVAPTAERPHV